jgi:hypothetical protein
MKSDVLGEVVKVGEEGQMLAVELLVMTAGRFPSREVRDQVRNSFFGQVVPAVNGVIQGDLMSDDS